MANRFYESGLFEYAEPNFVLFVEPATNDEFYEHQWALNNSAITDMDVPEAWGISTGAGSIRIAVLDNGVELTHPDLQNQLNSGYDATGSGTNGGPTYSIGPKIAAEAHGTACAGIAAAQANNTIGIAGVAYSCRVVPVRVYSNSQPADITTAGWIAAGIDWAWRNNRADVLSLSFAIGVGMDGIAKALNDAATLGRNYQGCVVLAATGNNNDAVLFPATVPSVIAVGSTTIAGFRASDANYGAGLDIVAPGEGLSTTDLQGDFGYNTDPSTNRDYTGFRGTSAATPNAAGVAALVLSVAPGLTGQQARQILESSATKVGGYAYTFGAGENGGLTWNNQTGYGRVNAYNAVLQAQQAVCNPAVAGVYYCGRCSPTGDQEMQAFNYVATGSISINVRTPIGANCTFSIYPSNFTITKTGPTSAYFQIGPVGTSSQQRVQVDIVTATPCGSSAGSFQFYVPGYFFQASPNPAATELTIQVKEPVVDPWFGPLPFTHPAPAAFEARLYNTFGQVVKAGRSHRGKITLGLADVPTGLYTLRAGSGPDALSEHIQVVH